MWEAIGGAQGDAVHLQGHERAGQRIAMQDAAGETVGLVVVGGAEPVGELQAGRRRPSGRRGKPQALQQAGVVGLAAVQRPGHRDVQPHRLQADAQAVLGLEVRAAQDEAEGVGGREGERALHVPGVAVVEGVVVRPQPRRIEVLDIAVMLADRGGDVSGEGVGEPARDIAGQVSGVVVAIAGVQAGVHRVARVRRVGAHDDRAAGGVAPVERALRAGEHLHLLGGVQIEGGAGQGGDIDAVHIGGDRGRLSGAGERGSDAADEGADVAGGVLDRQGRAHPLQLQQVGDPARLDLGGGDRLDGDGGLLQVFGAPLGGDDHLVELRAGSGCVGRRRAGRGRPGQGADAERCDGDPGQQVTVLHGFPLRGRRFAAGLMTSCSVGAPPVRRRCDPAATPGWRARGSDLAPRPS